MTKFFQIIGTLCCACGLVAAFLVPDRLYKILFFLCGLGLGAALFAVATLRERLLRLERLLPPQEANPTDNMASSHAVVKK
jgi:hypothetical protein